MSTRHLLAALVALCLGLLAARGAEAHASLVGSEPADGLVVAAAPDAVSLIFDEPTELTQLRLTRPDGRSTDSPTDGRRLATHRVPLPVTRLEGTHVLSWRAVSEDGHPVGGTVVFSVGHASAEPAFAVPAGMPATVAAGLWLSRLAVALGTAFGVGGVAFLVLVAGPGTKAASGAARAMAAALGLGTFGAVAGVGFQGLDLAGRDLAGLADFGLWWAGLVRTPQGATALMAGLSFGLAGAGLHARSRPLALAALVLSGAAFAGSGHAVTAPPRWLTQAFVFLHALAMSAWIGAFVPLASLAWNGSPDLDRTLRRFSDLIPFGLIALFASGLGLAVVQLGDITALGRTSYGQAFLIKLALVAAVLALALVNRAVLTSPARAGVDRARRRLAASIVAESALCAGVLGAAGLWRFTTPPRLLPVPAPDTTVTLQADRLRATVTLHPARVGRVRLTIGEIRDGEVVLSPPDVTVTLEKPSFGLGPFRKTALKDGRGAFRPVDVFLPLDGIWIVSLDVLVDEFRQATLRDVLIIDPAG